jgi:hypothetical protein
MTHRLCLAGLALLLAACTATGVRIDTRALAPQSGPADRYIIAAVDNQPEAVIAHAGSSPRGYDTVSDYGASSHARRVLHEVETEYGLREVSAWPIDSLRMHCAVLEIPAGADRAHLLERLAQDHRIRLTQPLQTFATRTQAYNDPYLDLQRGFQLMDVAGAHPVSRGEGVKIAIIDTGADTEHKDLRGAIVGAANFVDADAQQFRKDRHGTEIAGVIAAVANNNEGIVGIAPAARLLVYKACWQLRVDEDAASCNSFTLARALAAAFDAHAQVVNMSLAGPHDPLVGDLIREGQRRGIVFVGAADEAAASQGGVLHQPGVIEVASSESRSALDGTVYAPGREILTLLPGGRYDFATGVSIATAEVSAVVALMLAKSPALSAGVAARMLRETSDSEEGGLRRIDACAAVLSLTGSGNCRAGTAEHAAKLANH